MLVTATTLCLLVSAVSVPSLAATSAAGHAGLSPGRPGHAPVPQESTASQLKRALQLRNASGPHWNAREYSAAAEKLKEALSLYQAINAASGDGDGHAPERATTLRALVWNEFRAGEEASALAFYEALFDLASDHPEVLHERQSAYGAVFEHAGTLSTRADVEAYWGALAELFEAYDDEERLAQLLLDRAGSYSALGDVKRQRADLTAAVLAHEAIDDHNGANWGRNNLGFSYLSSGEWSKALDSIGSALAEVRAGRGLAPQSALGYNLLAVTRGVLEGGRPDRDVVASLWSIAEAEARASNPSIVAPERLLVGALSAQLARSGAKRAKDALGRLRVAMPGAPDSALADLSLHAAEILLEGGEPGAALSELSVAPITDGPVFPHLRVRQLVLQASAAGALGDRASFDEFAELAIEALSTLGHDAATREAFERLANVAEGVKGSRVGAEIQGEWKRLRRMGQPGGAGGSSLRGKNGPRPDALPELGAQEPLFRLLAQDGQLIVTDLLSGDEVKRPLEWLVRTVGFHGMKMELFGGYVQIAGMNYGSGSGTKGSRAGLSLRDMQNFRPLDGVTALYVTQTGATFYGPVAK